MSLAERVTRVLNNDSVLGETLCNKLMQIVAENKGCIAGSVVMQAINDIRVDHSAWRTSDIDVWLPAKATIGTIVDLLEQNGYSITKMNPSSKKTYARLTKYVETIYSFTRRGKKTIQVMMCKVKRVSHVVNTFDIMAAKIMYRENDRGERKIGLIKTDMNAALQECLAHKLTISKYASENQSLVEWNRTASRLAKYKTRGFSLSPDELSRIVELIGKQSAIDDGYDAIQDFVLAKIATHLQPFLASGKKLRITQKRVPSADNKSYESFPVLEIATEYGSVKSTHRKSWWLPTTPPPLK